MVVERVDQERQGVKLKLLGLLLLLQPLDGLIEYKVKTFEKF